MIKLPIIKTKYGEGIGAELFFQVPDLQSYPKTFLSGDEASGQTTLSVDNGTGFSTNDWVILGQIGHETTEIVQVSSQTDTTIVTGATKFAHSRGASVRFIPYNQIIPERSTDVGVNYSALSAISIRVDTQETYLQRSSDDSTDYYRFRFYNSTTALYSQYSDGVVATGFADNSVGSIKQRALRSMGETLSDSITDEFLNEALWEGRRDLDQDPRAGKWNFRTKFNQDVGDIIPGTYSIAVPTDLRDPNTNEHILSLRIGRNNRPLIYQSMNKFNDNYRNIAHTTLSTAITGASVTLVLTQSGDFDESGSVYIAASTVAQTTDAVAYTSNNEATNTLSGVTGIADNKSAGVDIWQGASFGLPTAYTIYNGRIYFDIPFADSLAGENIWMDYYSKIVAYDSDADILDEPEYDLFVSWLKWKIKYHKSNGKLQFGSMMRGQFAITEPDYREYEDRKTVLIAKNYLGQDIFLVPDDGSRYSIFRHR